MKEGETRGAIPDGRTILLGWAYPGSGPACWDMPWYLALNRARLPESKEAAIGRSVADVVAAFVLNHLTDPGPGLAELARVTRPAGAVLAAVFGNASRSDARDRIDAAAIAAGWQIPD